MLSIILPTYNEAPNLPLLLERIAGVLERGSYEVIIVDDDSPDGTWQVAEKLVKDYPMVRVIRRIGRRGLSSAVVEGFDAARGETLLVMDSDLQHDPALISELRKKIEHGADIAVASRYIAGGSIGEWVRGRRFLSKTATLLARNVPNVEVSDPMSGFFALKKSVYESVRPMLRPSGFKILFEILTFLPQKTVAADVPLVFRMREHGESKLSAVIELQFLSQLFRAFCIRIQWMLFGGISIAVAMLLLIQASPLMPLYTDASIRAQAQRALSQAADDNGWLLSDLAIQSVNATNMRVIHRSHHAGPDEIDCLIVSYDGSSSPCSND